MSIELLNTVAIPNALLAHGKNHVAIYQGGVVSIYAKDNANNTLVLQPQTYALAGVLSLRMSDDGAVIAAQTATKTYRLTNGVQTPFDIIGHFAVANDGTIVVIDIVAIQISVIRDTTRNFSVAVNSDDRVAIGATTFVVYNQGRYYKAAFTGSTIPSTAFIRYVTYAAHVSYDKYAFFYTNGAVLFNGTERTITPKLYFHRNLGKYILGNDGEFDWAFTREHPQTFPKKLRANHMTLPVEKDFTSSTWMQMRFNDGTALEEVTEVVAALHATASVTAGKLVNTSATVTVMDKMAPPYFNASEDFSIEGWFNFSSVDPNYAGTILCVSSALLDTNRSFNLYVSPSDNTVGFLLTANGTAATVSSGTALGTLNADHHLAVCRVSNVLKIYFDGIEVYSGANSVSAFITTEFLNIRRGAIGKRWGLRILRGVSAYTTAFTPPAFLPDLIPVAYAPAVQADIVFQACLRRNALVNEVNGNAIALAGAAAVANGRIKTNADNTSRWSSPCPYFGAADFTIEVLLRVNANPAALCGIMNQYIDGSGTVGNSWLLWMNANTIPIFSIGSQASGGAATSMVSLTASKSIPLNVDAKLVIERVNNVITLYIDGVSAGTLNFTGAMFDSSATTPLRNLWNVNANSTSNVIVTNMRIAKRAMYRGIIPTTPTYPRIA